MTRLVRAVCVVILACVYSECLEFQIDRTSPRVPGAFCARLSCQENLATDPVTYSLVNMSIYRVAESHDRVLLASLTEVKGQLRHQGHPGVKVNGSIGKTSAYMDVLMSMTSDCQDTTYVCQLMFADVTGQIGVREKVVPTSTGQISANIQLGVPDTRSITTISHKSRPLTRAGNQRRRRSTEQIRIDPPVQRNESLLDDEANTKKSDTFIETPQPFLKSIEKIERRLVDVENMFQMLEKQLGISRNESLKSDLNETGRFIKWPFSYAEIVSQPKQVKCERNMNAELSKMTLVVLENGKVVMCDTKTDGGGWILIQRRIIGDVSFNRDWYDYKHGFGSYIGDFWLGNELVSNLTSQGLFDLRIELSYSNADYVIEYNGFRVEDEISWYKLRLGQRTKGSYDDLSYHRDSEFYTYDRDTSGQCAKNYMGGWWYYSCHNVNPNGLWNTHSTLGMRWSSLTDSKSVSKIEFKFRRHAT